MINYILFDLDGTLTDPGEGITNSVAYALNKFGITVLDKTTLYKFIGPPLINSFMEYYGFSKTKAEKAVEYYREYYSVKGIFENRLYDGIINLLENLKASNKKIILATSKPEKFAIEILKHFTIYDFFDFISGATMSEKRTEKSEVIAYALKEFNIDPCSALMVGDRKFDISGSHKNGIKAVGVLYGYGSKTEFKSVRADFIAETVSDLYDILLQN